MYKTFMCIYIYILKPISSVLEISEVNDNNCVFLNNLIYL